MKTYGRVRSLLQSDLDSGLSLRAVCRKADLHPNTVGSYLEGRAEVTQASLEKISAAYGKPVAWLRGDTDNDATPDIANAVAALSPVQQKMRDRMMELSDSQIELLLQVSEQFESTHK